MRTKMISGLTAFSASNPRFHLSNVPGRKFSSTTSTCGSNLRTISWPSGVRRSRVIELAFRLLKEYLGMSHWWRSKQELILVQIWVVLILSHLVYALRERIALVADCDPVEVSGPYWWICCLGLAAPQRSSSTSSCKR